MPQMQNINQSQLIRTKQHKPSHMGRWLNSALNYLTYMFIAQHLPQCFSQQSPTTQQSPCSESVDQPVFNTNLLTSNKSLTSTIDLTSTFITINDNSIEINFLSRMPLHFSPDLVPQKIKITATSFAHQKPAQPLTSFDKETIRTVYYERGLQLDTSQFPTMRNVSICHVKFYSNNQKSKGTFTALPTETLPPTIGKTILSNALTKIGTRNTVALNIELSKKLRAHFQTFPVTKTFLVPPESRSLKIEGLRFAKITKLDLVYKDRTQDGIKLLQQLYEANQSLVQIDISSFPINQTFVYSPAPNTRHEWTKTKCYEMFQYRQNNSQIHPSFIAPKFGYPIPRSIEIRSRTSDRNALIFDISYFPRSTQFRVNASIRQNQYNPVTGSIQIDNGHSEPFPITSEPTPQLISCSVRNRPDSKQLILNRNGRIAAQLITNIVVIPYPVAETDPLIECRSNATNTIQSMTFRSSIWQGWIPKEDTKLTSQQPTLQPTRQTNSPTRKPIINNGQDNDKNKSATHTTSNKAPTNGRNIGLTKETDTYQHSQQAQTISPTPLVTLRTSSPTHLSTQRPTQLPSYQPSHQPSKNPTYFPTYRYSQQVQTISPTPLAIIETSSPTHLTTQRPTQLPSYQPSHQPSKNPTHLPTYRPTDQPTHHQHRHYHLQPSTPFIIDVSFLQEFTSELIHTTFPSWMMYNHDNVQIEGFAPESIPTQTMQIGPFRLTFSN